MQEIPVSLTEQLYTEAGDVIGVLYPVTSNATLQTLSAAETFHDFGMSSSDRGENINVGYGLFQNSTRFTVNTISMERIQEVVSLQALVEVCNTS